jgi:hypothetical protein
MTQGSFSNINNANLKKGSSEFSRQSVGEINGNSTLKKIFLFERITNDGPWGYPQNRGIRCPGSSTIYHK